MLSWIRFPKKTPNRNTDRDQRAGFPPLDLCFDGIVEDKQAEKIYQESRFRVCLHPETDGSCEHCSRTIYWLTLEFQNRTKWVPMMTLHESRLSIIQSVLQDVANFLEAETSRAAATSDSDDLEQ